MAKPAGQNEMISVECDGSFVRGRQQVSLQRSADDVTVKQALAWIASRRQDQALAASVMGLSDTSQFAAARQVAVSVVDAQDGKIVATIRHTERLGGGQSIDINPTKEQAYVGDTMQDVLAHIALDWGFPGLADAISALVI